MADEPGICRMRGARKRFHRLFEFGSQRRRFVFGDQGVLEDAGSQNFHLIGGGAAIGIFERDHFALFGDAQTPADRAGGLGGYCLGGGRAASTDRSAASVEKGDRNASFMADLR